MATKKLKVRINVEKMRKDVNDFDKSFGLNLKKISPLNDPEFIFAEYSEYMKDYLINVIYAINGIHLPKNTDKSKISKDFSDLSILGWNDDKKYPQESMTFKCRFLTNFLLKYIEKVDKIALRKYDYLSKFKTGKYENGYFYLQNLANDTRRFIAVIIFGNEYSNIITQMNQNCSFMRVKKTDPIEVNKYIREIKHELKIGLKHSMFTSMNMDEDIAIDSVLKLAYLISTGDTDIRHAIPKFRFIEGATTDYELRGLIEELGSSILESHRNLAPPIMYLAYNKASPYITSKYKDINENWYISTGVRALEYTKFFCDDKYVEKFINKMLKNQNVK